MSVIVINVSGRALGKGVIVWLEDQSSGGCPACGERFELPHELAGHLRDEHGAQVEQVVLPWA